MILHYSVGPGQFVQIISQTNQTSEARSSFGLLNAVNSSLLKDTEVSKDRGLADYVDDTYQDYINSITVERCFSKNEEPYLDFSVDLNERKISSEQLFSEIVDYITSYIKDQCIKGWGDDFSYTVIKHSLNLDKDILYFYAPWIEEETEVVLE